VVNRLRRGLLIAAPFVLLAVGFGMLVASPWPAIFGLMIRGQHVVVGQNWRINGQLGVAVVCFVGALAISFNIKRR
jgi:hypothetical protein